MVVISITLDIIGFFKWFLLSDFILKDPYYVKFVLPVFSNNNVSLAYQ